MNFQVIEEFEDDKDTYTLSKKKLLSGIKTYMEWDLDIITRDTQTEFVLDTCRIDGCRADMIVQYALFGDLIYA